MTAARSPLPAPRYRPPQIQETPVAPPDRRRPGGEDPEAPPHGRSSRAQARREHRRPRLPHPASRPRRAAASARPAARWRHILRAADGGTMQRITCDERADWRETAEKVGFEFHTIDGATYWDES